MADPSGNFLTKIIMPGLARKKAKASGSPNRSDGPIAAAATPATAEQRRREANRKGREDSLLGGSTGSNNAGYGEIKRLLGQ